MKMNDEQRLQLQKGDKIRLFRSRDSSDVWEITDIAGEGSSAVCYEASCGNKTGRLKEFYPFYGMKGKLIRTSSNQLIPSSRLVENKFYRLCDDFTEAYLKLEQAKKADRENEVLNNFIPPYEILYGKDEEGVRGSVYIWTPDDKKGIGFDAYLRTVREYAYRFESTWKKVYEVISILYTLTDCVRVLHAAGFLHLDLKPSNFLIPYTGGKEMNTGIISLFDVNTLYDINQPIPRFAGSKGTRAPEVRRGRADNRSDIYSIGAMLYQALVVLDEAVDGMYHDSYYPYLSEMVWDSELLNKQEDNEQGRVKHYLASILRKCLAKYPEDRYDSCEDLMEDLDHFRMILYYSLVKKKMGTAEGKTFVGHGIDLHPLNDSKVWFNGRINLSVTAEQANHERIQQEQGCLVGLDIGHEQIQLAVCKNGETVLIPIQYVKNFPSAVCFQKDEILTGHEACLALRKTPDAGAKSVLSLLQENRVVNAGNAKIYPETFFSEICFSLRKAADTCIGKGEISAVLALPVDIDTECIHKICRCLSDVNIFVRRVFYRNTLFLFSAFKEYSVEEDILSCLFDGDCFSAAVGSLMEGVLEIEGFCSVDMKGKEESDALDEIVCAVKELTDTYALTGKVKVIVEGTFAERLFLKDAFDELGYVWADIPKEARISMGAADYMAQLMEKDMTLIIEVCAHCFDIRVGEKRYPCVSHSSLPISKTIYFSLDQERDFMQIELIQKSLDGHEKVIGGVLVPTAGYTEEHVAQVHVEIMWNGNLECVVSVVDRNGRD